MTSCPICLEETNKFFTLDCEDKFCNHCISTYIELELKNFNLEIKCPNYKTCNHVLSQNELAQFLSSKELIEKYEQAKQTKFIDSLNIFYCRCGEAYEIEENNENGESKTKPRHIVYCVKCKRESCSNCSLAPHSGDCVKVTPDQIELIEKGIIKHCPMCRVAIEKNNGCDHMKCKCGFEFYWSNLAKFDPRRVPDVNLPPDNLIDGWNAHRNIQNVFRNIGHFNGFNNLIPSHQPNDFQHSNSRLNNEQKQRLKFVPPVSNLPPRLPTRIIDVPARPLPSNRNRNATVNTNSMTNTSDNESKIQKPINKTELITMYKKDRKKFDKLYQDMSLNNTGLLMDSMRIDVLAKTLKLN